MEVVEQPFTGRADVRGAVRGRQPGVGFFEDPAGPVEAGQERGPPPGSFPGSQALSGGDIFGSLG
jgi:hypothetical protein